MQWSLEGAHWAGLRLYLPSAFLQCLMEMEAVQLQLGEERDALIQHTLEQSQDLEGRRGALTPSSPWVRAGPAGRGTPPLRGVTAWLSPLPAVAVPAELHQQVARESQGLLRVLEEERESYRSLEQE